MGIYNIAKAIRIRTPVRGAKVSITLGDAPAIGEPVKGTFYGSYRTENALSSIQGNGYATPGGNISWLTDHVNIGDYRDYLQFIITAAIAASGTLVIIPPHRSGPNFVRLSVDGPVKPPGIDWYIRSVADQISATDTRLIAGKRAWLPRGLADDFSEIVNLPNTPVQIRFVNRSTVAATNFTRLTMAIESAG